MHAISVHDSAGPGAGSKPQTAPPKAWRRALAAGLAAGLVVVLAGDRTVRGSAIGGIDPLEVLKLQVKNNVLFILDTSGSMVFPPDIENVTFGADDPASRMYQAKRAVEKVVQDNAVRMNFGFATYNVLNTGKALNPSTNRDGFQGTDGPFFYVSKDAAAAQFAQGAGLSCVKVGGNDASARSNFFCETSNTFGDWDSSTDGREIWRSFRNPQPAYPTGCTAGVNCRNYLESRFYRNGTEIHWNTANSASGGAATPSSTTRYTAAPVNYACPNPPAGLTGNNPDANGDGVADQPRPCVRMCNDATGNCATYYYTSGFFEITNFNFSSYCGGAAVLTAVSPCTGDNSGAVLAGVQDEILVNPSTGALQGLTANDFSADTRGGAPSVNGGVRAGQGTPLAGSLAAVRTASPPAFPTIPAAVVGRQKNFVILLTDGDDSCAGGTTAENAVSSAREAQSLYGNTGSPRNQAETLVIAFTSTVNKANADKISKAGSGGIVGAGSTADVTCPAGVPCRDAFTATSGDELLAALNAAIDLIVSGGTFAAAPGIVGTVFEKVVSPASPLDPNTRYTQRVNLLFQSSFDLPKFEGESAAFRNDGSYADVTTSGVNSLDTWDTGQTLHEKVSEVLAASSRSGRPANFFSFDELHAGETVDSIADSSSALIKRRVFTSAGNDRFPRTAAASEWDSANAAGRNVVALWPPNQTGLNSGVADVDPAVGSETVNTNAFDNAFGIGAASGLTFADLRTQLGACDVTANNAPGTGSPAALPAGCASSNILTARKEAREILIAWIAGARLARGSDGKPFRDGTSRALLFRDRGWILLDQTYGSAAVVTPPLRTTPNSHVREWVLLRDGRRNSQRQGIDEIDKGFGLRNPDYDDTNPETKLDLKPRKTVVYIPGNDGLHAADGGTGEELWSFVPFDQLSKIKGLVANGQVSTPHTFMVASSVRVADVFLPAAFTLDGLSYDGRWRTVILFGRGAGGKYYTALDVTAPGPYTRPALKTNPPYVMWSRGNPDTRLDGTAVRAADSVPYSKMGETWSTPAVGNVDLTTNSLPEWRVFTGSGYGETASEGTTFYTLDAATGDVLASIDIGDAATPLTAIPDNALVANAAAFNSFQQDAPGATNRSPADYVTRVFIPDVHGRIWKFAAGSGGQFADVGTSQPMADAVALLKINNVLHVYAESGNDNRIAVPPSPTPPFRMFGFQDTGGDAAAATPGTALPSPFPLTFPGTYRGTSQPGAAFNSAGNGRVFFVGSRFNLPGANCLSSFDSVLFAVGAESGGAVYDFGSGVAPYTEFIGKRLVGPQLVGGQAVVSELGASPSPGVPNTVPTPGPPAPAQIKTIGQSAGSPVCRQ